MQVDDDEDFELDGIQVTVNPEEDQFSSGADESDLEGEAEEVERVDDLNELDNHSVVENDVSQAEANLNESQSAQQKSGERMKKLRADLQKDPEVQMLIQEMVEENLRKESGPNLENWAERRQVGNQMPKSTGKMPENGKVIKRRVTCEAIKSPSDTTLYTPALKKRAENSQVIDQISDFVEGIRIQEKRKSYPGTPDAAGESNGRQKGQQDVHQGSPKRSQHDVADQIILDAKRFRGNIAAPKGMVETDVERTNQVKDFRQFLNVASVLSPEIEMLRRNDNDDDFFHITCHIEPGLRAKIEWGQFVELERLLSRDNSTRPLNEDR